MKLPTASGRQAQGGASGKCRYNYKVGSLLAPAYRQEGGAFSRLAREKDRTDYMWAM